MQDFARKVVEKRTLFSHMAGVQIPASLLCSERDEHHRSNVPREVEVSTALVEFHISCVQEKK